MPANFSWLLPGRVAGMARPIAEDEEWLREQGVTSLVSLTLTPPSLGFRILHVPIPDMHSPSVSQLRAAVDFIRAAWDEGGGVAVHCGAGMGRTGTVLAAVLVAEGSRADQAIAEVRAARSGSIETREQEQRVREYAVLLEGGET